MLIEKLNKDFQLLTIIQMTDQRELWDIGWSAFWKMLDYDIVLVPNYYSGNLLERSYRLQCKWNASVELVEEAWQDCLSKHINLPENIIEKSIGIIEDIYIRVNDSKRSRNTFSLDFLDIENNNNRLLFGGMESVVCKIIEKTFVLINEYDPTYASGIISRMVRSNAILIQRLALLFYRKYDISDANIKAEYVLNKFTLHEPELREQLFKLIANVFDQVNKALRERIIDQIWSIDPQMLHYGTEEDRIRAVFYCRYNWLFWLKTKCTNVEKVNELLEDILRHYPDFKPRERPELLIGSVSTKWGSESPISKEEFKSYNPKDARIFIETFQENSLSSGPDRDGLLMPLREVCSDDLNWGISFIEELKTHDRWQGDLWNAVFKGLVVSSETKRDMFKVLKTVDDNVIAHNTLCITQYIYDVLTHESILRQQSENSIKSIIKLIKKMWQYRSEIRVKESDWMTMAINNPTGILAMTLMQLMQVKQEERKIPEWLDRLVKHTIEKNDNNIEEYICIINWYSAHLFYRDKKWTNEHVFKYLEEKKESIRQAAWEGLLAGVRNFDVAIGKVLLPFFKRYVGQIYNLSSDYRGMYIHNYVLLMVFIIDNPIEEYLSELIVRCDEIDRVRITHAIRKILKNMQPETREELWERWLRKYWELRNKNFPVEIKTQEYAEMLCWLVGLPAYEEAVNVALNTNIEEVNLNLLVSELENTDEVERFPEKSAELIINLIRKSDRRTIDRNVNNIIKKLIQKGVTDSQKKELEDVLI